LNLNFPSSGTDRNLPGIDAAICGLIEIVLWGSFGDEKPAGFLFLFFYFFIFFPLLLSVVAA